MKFADLNFAWADARAVVACTATVSTKAARTVETVRITCDTVAAPAAAVSLAAKAERRQQLAFAGRKTPVTVKATAKNVDPRWVDVLAAMAEGVGVVEAIEVVKTTSAAKVAQAKAVTVKAAMSLADLTVKGKKTVKAGVAKATEAVAEVAEVVVRRWTAAEKAAAKVAKAARKAQAVIAKKAAAVALKAQLVADKATAQLTAATAALAEGIDKKAIEAVVGTEVAQAAINAEFARLINSIKTLQARTYVFNGKDKVSYTDTRTGATSYYVIEWKAHEVVSFKVQG